jgi:prevent-host-death family protein
MEEVGVRELKAKLSEYVRRARLGDTIVVTDRGRPAAVLGPVPGRVRLEEGVQEGWITPARRRGLGPAKRHPGSHRVSDVLAEDREG